MFLSIGCFRSTHLRVNTEMCLCARNVKQTHFYNGPINFFFFLFFTFKEKNKIKKGVIWTNSTLDLLRKTVSSGAWLHWSRFSFTEKNLKKELVGFNFCNWITGCSMVLIHWQEPIHYGNCFCNWITLILIHREELGYKRVILFCNWSTSGTVWFWFTEKNWFIRVICFAIGLHSCYMILIH